MPAPAHHDNTGHAGKSVHLIPPDTAVKRLCFDDATQSLRPNLVLVDRQGSVVFEINELGLKGAARDLGRKLVVVWGDSVVFGIRWSWPCLLDALAPGYQFLNGGIEADPYTNILQRATTFNRAHDVALNILLPGWHPMDATHAAALLGQHAPARKLGRLGAIVARRRGKSAFVRAPSPRETAAASGNRCLREDLLEFLEATRNTVVVTMPTALNGNIVERDLSPLFTESERETVFRFAGDFPYSLAAQRYLFDHITERNAIVRDVAATSGVPLVDLAAAFDTQQLDDFRRDFFDVLHLRPRAYPQAAAAVHAGIKDLL